MADRRVIEIVTKYEMSDPINKLAGLEKAAKEAEASVKKLYKEMQNTSDVAKKSDLKKQWQDAKTESDKATKSVEQHRKAIDITSMSYQQLKNYADKLNKAIAAGDRTSKSYTDNLKKLGEVEKEMKKATEQANKLKKAGEDLGQGGLWNKITSGVKGIGVAFQAIVALQIITWIVDVGKSIFDTTAKFEKYESTLTVTTGSQEKAKQTMLALRNLAKELPQTTEQLTESYIKLSNRGLRPGSDEMKRLTDFALKSGKGVDDLSEAINDINNSERWSEFGVKVTTSGNKISTTIDGVKKSFDRTEQGAMEMAVALGSVRGTMGLAEKQMDSLGGAASNVEDGLTDLVLMMGDLLEPVFKLILQILGFAIEQLKNFIKILISVGVTIKNFGTAAIGVFKGAGDAIKGFFTGIGGAIKQILSGNFNDLGKNFDGMKKGFANASKEISTAAKKNKADVAAIWVTDTKKVELEGKKGGKAYMGASEAEIKKALEERKKAQEDALKKIGELENEAYLNNIKRTKGEVEAEKEALKQKFEEEKSAIEKSKAAKAEKDKQIVLLKNKLDRTIEELQLKHEKTTAEIIDRWVDDEYVKKIKKAQDFANTELANARKHIKDKEVLAGIERKIEESLQKEIAAIREEQKNDSIKKAEDTAKKGFEIANKKLANEKFIMEQEHKAQTAMLDGQEIQYRNSKTKLLQIQKERLDTELRQLKEKLALEQKAEELKIKQDVKDETERNQALARLNDAYRTREKEETNKTEQAKADIEKKKLDERQKMREGFSNAFGALLKGDMLSFVNHLDSMIVAEKSAAQKKVNANMGKFQMIGQLAVQAANFINDLTQKKVARELEATKAEFVGKKAMLDASIQAEKDAIEQAENAKKGVKEQYAQQVKDIKEANEKSISDAEQFYNDLSSGDAQALFAEKVSLANSEANEKIAAAKKAESEAKQSAQSERDERIISANAAKNAEIAAINERADFDTATKKRLIDEAKAKAEQEIMLAKSEAEQKIQLSREEKEKKLADAKEEKEAKIKLLEQLKTATKEQAKELLDAAKADAKAKVDTAEKEKNQKLTILAEEKAKREVSKKQLEATLAEEDRKAKNKEAQLKYQSAMSQWKTDQITAGVNGALAIIKSFATGGPILGIVFAAITAIATGIQIAAIRKNRPPTPQSFASGGFAPTGGIGGVPAGPMHGAKYGDAGLAIVNRNSGREEGEMEGGEAIISRDQTEANLPLIQQMWSKARRKDKTPVRTGFRPMAFAYGGIMPSLGNREMFLFGSKKRKAAAAEAEASAAADMGGADTEGIDTAAASAAQEKAQKNAEDQTKLMEEIRDELKLLNDKTASTVKNTSDNVVATNDVKKAVESGNSNSKLDGVIGAISSWGKK